ncbi:MAG: hypothetical protein R3A80_04360 [Bdellovibrionota bacterium]
MAKKRQTAGLSTVDKRILLKFGRKVRGIREKKKLSVYDITGEDLPIKSRQHWQLIELGQKNINLTTIFKIAQSLEIKIENLLQDIEE